MRENLPGLRTLHDLLVDLQGFSGLFHIDHTVEGHFLPDIIVHSVISHVVGECDHPLLIRKMAAVFIQQFCLQHRLQDISDLTQGKHGSILIDGKIIRKHLHAPVVLPFNLSDMVRTEGKGAQAVVRLCAGAEPKSSVFLLLRRISIFCLLCLISIFCLMCVIGIFCLLCRISIFCLLCTSTLPGILIHMFCGPGSCTLKVSVFIRCKTMFLEFFSVPVICGHFEGHSRHPFLSIAVDLAQGKVSADDAVPDGCITGSGKICDLSILLHLETDRFRALLRVSLGSCGFLCAIGAVRQGMR